MIEINFNNVHKPILYAFIAILLIFAIIYSYQTKKQEGFASYYVTGANDTVILGGLNKVKVGTANSNINLIDAITMDSTFSNNVKSKVDETTSNFVTLNDLNDSINSLPQMNQIITQINNSIAGFARQTDVTTQINTAVNNRATVDYVNGQVNAISTPAFTIVAIYDTIVPSGWQLCNGAPLKLADNITLFQRNGQTVNTPDLRGRTIIGTGQGTGMTNRTFGATGGAETHTLTIAEMPSHDHDLWGACDTQWNSTGNWGLSCGVLRHDVNRTTTVYGPDYGVVRNNGGGQPHNNMQPFVAITYIIKQPVSNAGSIATTTTRLL